MPAKSTASSPNGNDRQGSRWRHLALLALARFSTGLAFVLCFTGLKRLGSVGTTAHAYLREPIGVGMVFHGELPQPSAWMGLAFIVVAVIAMTLPAGRHLRPA